MLDGNKIILHLICDLLGLIERFLHIRRDIQAAGIAPAGDARQLFQCTHGLRLHSSCINAHLGHQLGNQAAILL